MHYLLLVRLHHIVLLLTEWFAFRATLSSGSLITGITTNTQTPPWTLTLLMMGISGLTSVGCGIMRYAHSQLYRPHMWTFYYLMSIAQPPALLLKLLSIPPCLYLYLISN